MPACKDDTRYLRLKMMLGSYAPNNLRTAKRIIMKFRIGSLNKMLLQILPYSPNFEL
jgi:hypothetical protein